ESPPPFIAQAVEVEVDTVTGAVQVLKQVSAVDCGQAINPKLAEGQIEGAAVNGISYAMTEEYIFSGNGRMINSSFKNYKIPTAADLPEMKTVVVPSHEPSGPFGAKSVGEIGINCPMPAIANAIYDAVGVRLYEAPFTPEKVYRAIRKQQEVQ
ncbi:MAG: molybdopterin-dependent oxidoreductase, partial [Candidatus Marinimicrobia bacterium]|nr:molybdopterin-dependent oxidoreductase [Candidatus Neomarinimicrobiota bacterium]